MDFHRFLRELKERNVVRVAGVYTVTAWGVFQVAKTVFETLALPKFLPALTLLILALGLPVVLAAYWAMSRARARARAAEAPNEVDGGEEAAPPPKTRMGWVDWGVLGVVAVVAVVAVVTMAGLVGALRGGGEAGLTMGPASKSVAVLPFANFSNAADAEYFADGLTEEVINSLAQVPELKVAGRTSAFYFKGRNEDLREIGKKLNVSHVVEGSVRRSGSRLRVTCQLVSVRDGFHVWSQTYDRTMDDAFAIQTEIADGVAEALKVKLNAGERLRRPIARDPDAYRLQVVAKGQLRQKGKAQVQSAQAIFKRLIELEPENAEVRAYYAYASAYLAQNHVEGDFLPAIRVAETQIAKALELDPKSAAAYVARGMVNATRYVREGRQSAEAQADIAYKRATELAPRDPEALSLYGDFLSSRRPAEALSYLRRALEIDPLDRVANNAMAYSLYATGKTAEAEQRYKSNVALFPDYVDAKEQLAGLLGEVGKLDEAVLWYRSAAKPLTDPSASVQLANLYYNLGMPKEADAAMAPWKTHPVVGGLGRAVELIVGERYAELQAFVETKLAEPEPDPVWRSGLALAGVMQGDYELARRQFLITSPEFFSPAPKVSPGLVNDAIVAAYAIEKTGDAGQARRLLLSLLAATEAKPGWRQPSEQKIARVKAYAMLGERARALAELRAAIDSGYRQLYDLDFFVRLDDYPMTESLQNDSRFKAMIAEVLADNARMRAKLSSKPS